MPYTRRFALGAIASAVLVGCGGGGDGDGAPVTPGGGTGGTGTGGTGTGGTGGSQAFAPFGPAVVASNASRFHGPAVARLTGGGNVVLWASGQEIRGRLTDAAGATVGNDFVVNPGYTRALGSFAVAPAADGGFVVAWGFETERPNTQFHAVTVIQAKRFDAAASPVWEKPATGIFHNVGRISIEPFGDGFLIGWTARFILTAPDEGWLGRIAVDGSQVGDQRPVLIPGGGPVEAFGIAALTGGTVVAVWRQGTSAGGFTSYMRPFSASLDPLVAPVVLPGSASTTSFPVDAEGLADGNVAVAWGRTGENTRPFVATAVFTPAGTLVSTVQAEVTELPPTAIQVLSFGSAGYGVAWQVTRIGSRDVTASLFLWRLSLAGQPAALPQGLGTRLTYTVSPTSGAVLDAGNGADFAGGADGHYVLAYHQVDIGRTDTYLVGR